MLCQDNKHGISHNTWWIPLVLIVLESFSPPVMGTVPPGGREVLWYRNGDYANMVKNDVYLWKRHEVSKVQCSVECTADIQCASLFYNEDMSICIGYNRVLIATEMTSSTGYSFYYHRPDYCIEDFNYEKTVNLCFKIFTVRKSAADALQDCEALNGGLVIIDTEDKLNVITSHSTFDTSQPSYFIDGSDSAEDGVFRYSDGRLVPSSFWMTGEPNGIDGVAKCIQMFSFPQYKWFDYDCTASYSFICEIRS